MISECVTHDQILKGIFSVGCAEELGMPWVSSLCTNSDAELISTGSGLAFRNTSWCDQALGVWGLMLF